MFETEDERGRSGEREREREREFALVREDLYARRLPFVCVCYVDMFS